MDYKPIKLTREIVIEKLYSLHYFSYSKKFRFEGERHDFWELIYCDSGEAEIADENEKYTLKEGESFLHAPNRYHTVTPNDKYTNVAIVSFDGKLSRAADLAGQILQLDKQEKSLLAAVIAEGRAAFSEPLNLVYQFELKLAAAPPAGALQLIQNNIENLLIRLSRKSAEREKTAPPQAKTHAEALAGQVLAILKESLHAALTLREIASKVNYSETYIKKVFREVTKESIIQHFIRLKIERSKQLLSEGAHTITQISEVLGFDSVQYFSRTFKKITNMSPNAYRNSIAASGVL